MSMLWNCVMFVWRVGRAGTGVGAGDGFACSTFSMCMLCMCMCTRCSSGRWMCGAKMSDLGELDRRMVKMTCV